MTPNDLEAELALLRHRIAQQEKREEMRRKNWFANGNAVRACSVLYVLIAAGVFEAKALFPGAWLIKGPACGYLGLVFVVTATTLMLLSASLEAVSGQGSQ